MAEYQIKLSIPPSFLQAHGVIQRGFSVASVLTGTIIYNGLSDSDLHFTVERALASSNYYSYLASV